MSFGSDFKSEADATGWWAFFRRGNVSYEERWNWDKVPAADAPTHWLPVPDFPDVPDEAEEE